MPAGTSWPSYLGATVGALMSMFAGAQVVHLFYKPLQDLDFKVEIEKKKLEEMANVAESTNTS